MGSIEYPAELIEGFETGRQSGDSNTYDFRFKAENPNITAKKNYETFHS